jgi:hypothetical protein
MALTIPCTTSDAVSIGDYLDHVRSKVDLRDPDSLAASAPMLRALANDRSLVVSELNRRIEDYFANVPVPSAQTLMLGRGENFYVRANIWPAIGDMANGRAYQDQFAYNIAHDHNFSFLTVSYLGPGYETELYEYEYDKVEGYVGEPVDVRFVRKAKFGTGTVMLYRASRDVHVQYAPEELTITLNLMVALPESRTRDQFYFDLATKTISGYPNELQASVRASFVRLAGHAGDANTAQLLSDLAARHSCRRTRLTAFEALCRRQPGSAAEIWRKAAADPAPLVANAARRHLREFERG